jgi:N6-L-threonylcarbamoyladenine synthase
VTSTRGGASFHSGLILGIETSCDETSVSLLDRDGVVRANLIASQIERHRPFGGVVPEIASREHLKHLMPLVTKATADAGASLDDVSAVAVTSGPGLIGALLVGVAAAQALAWGRGLPLYAVNHLEGHIVSPYLYREGRSTPMPERYLALVVSGGHSSIYDVRPGTAAPVAMMNRTRDDAAGEVFDKVAKFVGFPYPGGPHVEQASREAKTSRFTFPVAKFKDGSFDFSFSGLKASAIRLARTQGLEGAASEGVVSEELADFCRGFQSAIVEQLVDRLDGVWNAMAGERDRPAEIAIAGGVAANGALRDAVDSWGRDKGVVVRLPERIFCTDNAAMIAFAAIVMGEPALDPTRIIARSRFQPGTQFPVARG